jgi:hypothetical protein
MVFRFGREAFAGAAVKLARGTQRQRQINSGPGPLLRTMIGTKNQHERMTVLRQASLRPDSEGSGGSRYLSTATAEETEASIIGASEDS